MMAAVFSPATWDQDYAAALVPFRMRSFYGTPAFDRALCGPDGVLKGRSTSTRARRWVSRC